MPILISAQTNPYWNVAVENYLVNTPLDGGIPILYLWRNHRTVVIGQNQNPYAECNLERLLGDGGFLMRRTTGGGAVYHDDGNINFSFVAPPDTYNQGRHYEVIRKALQSYGLDVELSGRNDLLCQGRKFSGNAFSKGRCNWLHHGTLLISGDMADLSLYLKVKPVKLQKHGVQSVRSRVVNLSELAPVTSLNIVPRLVEAYCEEYHTDAQQMDFQTVISQPDVQELYAKFSSDDWLYGRWKHFQATCSAQFDWGAIDLQIMVDEQKGIITDLQLATDALDTDLNTSLRNLLVGATTDHAPQLPHDHPQFNQLSDILTLIY